MRLSLFHLNIWEGAFIDRITNFVHAYDFDLLQFQEVNGGKMSRGGYYPYLEHNKEKPVILNEYTTGIDCYAVLKEKLPDYTAKQVIAWQYEEDPKSYVSNVTIFKPSYKLLRSEIIRHTSHTSITDATFFPIENHPRASLALLLEKEGKKFWSINTHLAWGPTPDDADFKMQQAKKLYNFVTQLSEPVILSGDFNMNPNTQVVQMFEELGKNLTRDFGVTNTLNPRIHKAKQLFPPGIAVDYIFISPQFTVENFEVIDDDLSDHLGLVAHLTL